MKKFFIASLLFVMVASGTNAKASNRLINGVVSSVDAEYIYVSTNDGNGWVLDYENDFEIGNELTIVFDDMETESIYDDEIISVVK